jgi:dimethylargininase
MHAIRTSRDLATRFRLTKSTIRTRSTLAIARQIPDSFTNALSHHASASTDDAVSLSKSRCQHEIYLQALRHHVPTICLPPLEANPDCAFVEDTVVAIGNVAVICRLGHVSRQGESDSIKDVLVQLGVEVIDMRDYKYSDGNADELACCDGGDVLYTGRHLFVGLSERTNVKGFELLQCVFGDKVEVVLVPPVIQGKDVLHLKSAGELFFQTTLIRCSLNFLILQLHYANSDTSR